MLMVCLALLEFACGAQLLCHQHAVSLICSTGLCHHVFGLCSILELRASLVVMVLLLVMPAAHSFCAFGRSLAVSGVAA